jgi:hypothetical protein
MKVRLSAVILALSASPALTQSVNYKGAETVAGVASQLDYFATAKKDCSPTPPPSIKVITPPKHGLLTIRRGTVTTNKIPNCPNLQTPVNVIFYTGNAGYAGADEIVYEVTDAKGEIAIYNINVKVNEGPKPAVKSPEQPL